MTEHILNFAVGIEDDKIIDAVMENAKNSIIDDIKRSVIDRMFVDRRGYYNSSCCEFDKLTDSYKVKSDAVLSDMSKDIIEKIFAENKDQIIELAAEKLSDSYKRTKAWKEKTEGVTK